VPKGLGVLERGGTRESGRATYLGYEKRYWMLRLRQDERHTARVLGLYEAATWEGGGETEACSRPWDALVADELSAALLLGYMYSSQTWGEEREAVEEALGWVIVSVETQARGAAHWHRHDRPTDSMQRPTTSPAVLVNWLHETNHASIARF
jgi:hypothetical protein